MRQSFHLWISYLIALAIQCLKCVSHKCMQESNVYLNKLHVSVVDVPFFLGEKKQDDVIICKLVQEQWNFNRKKHCNFVIRGIFWEILRDYTRHCILLLPMWNMTMQKLWPYQNLMHNLLSKDLWVKQFSLCLYGIQSWFLTRAFGTYCIFLY